MGSRFGKYTLVRKIASGGMAEVFLARADGVSGFQKQLVIKRILPNLAEDDQFVAMFLNEARVASQLSHPAVVSIYELGKIDGSYYIAMEHIDGPNLRSLCRRAHDGKITVPAPLAVKIISAACEGLHYAHEAVGIDGSPLNLIHRDISPDNILVSRQGAVKVVDFGIAKAANQPHLTKSGVLKGKIAYMPPEQLRGHPVDRRADIFALGVCLFEILAGVRPFDFTSEVAMMQAILNDPPSALRGVRPDLDADLEAIVLRALAKDRDQRYATCHDLQLDLDRYLLTRGLTVNARDLALLVEELAGPPVPIEPTPPPVRRESNPLLHEAGEISIKGMQADLLRAAGDTADPVLLTNATGAPLSESQVRSVSRTPPAVGAVVALVAVAAVGIGAYSLGTRGAAPAPIAVAPPVVAPPPVAVAPAAAPVVPPVVAPPPPVVAPAAVAAAPVVAPAPAAVAPAHPVAVSAVAAADPEVNRHAADPKHHAHHVDPPIAVVPPPVLPAPVAKTGQLELRVLPWANVEIDRRAFGQTPISVVTLDVGLHHVVLTNSDLHARKEMDVTISANEKTVLKNRMADP